MITNSYTCSSAKYLNNNSKFIRKEYAKEIWCCTSYVFPPGKQQTLISRFLENFGSLSPANIESPTISIVPFFH